MKKYILYFIVSIIAGNLYGQYRQSNTFFSYGIRIETPAATEVTSSTAKMGCSYITYGKIDSDLNFYSVVQWNTTNQFPPINFSNPGSNTRVLKSKALGGGYPTNTWFNIDNLNPNTTYYVRALVVAGRTSQYETIQAWNTISFKTLPSNANQPISNNIISNGNSVVCINSGDTYTLTGSTPQGGSGNYTYQWQKTLDTNNTWDIIPNSNSINFNATVPNFDTIWYKRVVISDPLTNNSAPVFLAPNRDSLLNISQEPSISKNSITLKCSPSGNNIKWQVSSDSINFRDTLTGSSSITLKETPYLFQAVVTTGSGNCPVIKSPVVAITPPDGDGNLYAAVLLDTIYWTINNLRTSKFNDGTSVEYISAYDTIDWKSKTTAIYCWYNDDSNNVDNVINYGALYNYYVVLTSSKNVCPAGWRVPNAKDWNNLNNFVGGKSIAGNKLKSKYFWLGDPGINIYNFNATPAGIIMNNGSVLRISEVSWISMDNHPTELRFEFEVIYKNNNGVAYLSYQTNPSRRLGNSIRCVKD